MKWFLAALTALSISWVQAADFKAGQHYFELDYPVRTNDPNKVEVVELFWYGCPHCFRVEPSVNAWNKALQMTLIFSRFLPCWAGPGSRMPVRFG